MKRVAPVLVLVAALAAAVSLAPRPGDETLQVASPVDPGEGSCDVDGVAAGYDADFLDAAFRVTHVTVSGISTTCDGATLVVELLDDGAVVGTTRVAGTDGFPVTQTSERVEVQTPLPAAEVVDGIRVELAGGEVPIPAECRRMKLETIRIGTTGDDSIVGTQKRDLIYGQRGADVLDGSQNPDCIDGGPGDDLLRGDNQDDVLLGGDGDDVLEGGNGKDVLYGGPGDDHLDGGLGTKDECHGGGGNDTFVNCEKIR